MGIFAIFSYSNTAAEVTEMSKASSGPPNNDSPVAQPPDSTTSTTSQTTSKPAPAPKEITVSALVTSPRTLPASPSTPDLAPLPTPPSKVAPVSREGRRFSFRSLSFSRTRHEEPTEHKPALSAIQVQERKANASAAFSKRFIKSNSKKRAHESALIARSLIIGPSSAASPKVTPAIAKPQINKLKSQLSQPKSANKVIAQLRALPVSEEKATGGAGKVDEAFAQARGPIHAVCLAHTDAEENELHFAKLTGDVEESDEATNQVLGFPGVNSAPMDKLATMFNEMRIIDLVKSPDLGLGQPGDGEGLLAGAVPTAETVIRGIEQITPQLMALGFATGRAIMPDHKGVYPPTDRMSVLTYWWGLELCLPPPSLEILSNAKSVAGTVVNFLSALALVNNGVREILPFVRYISQFIDFEFNAIKGQDKGQGVVCAATWIMPAAMVPRPWDFPTPSSDTGESEKQKTEQSPHLPAGGHPPSTITPLPVLTMPEVMITSATASAESVPSLATSPTPGH